MLDLRAIRPTQDFVQYRLQREGITAKLPGEYADHLMLYEVRDGKLVDRHRLRQSKLGRTAELQGRTRHITVENNDHHDGPSSALTSWISRSTSAWV